MLKIIQKTSPNFLLGRTFGGIAYKPEAIVIHIMEGSLTGTDSWFASFASAVSSHYGIGRAGEIHQYVSESDSASHAGIEVSPSWHLLKTTGNPNYYTIGIEHEGTSTTIWTEETKQASAALIKDICTRWNIPLDRDHIIGHYEIKSSKPNCPAINKGIIDELIKIASTGQIDPKKAAIQKIEEALSVLKS